MALLMANNSHWQKHLLARIELFAETYLSFWNFFNLHGRAKRNFAHHYDLKDNLFDEFLDRAVNILAAVSLRPVTDAQITKLARRLGANLCLQPNQKILDIGFEWGRLPNAFSAYRNNQVETAALMPVN